MPTAMPIRSKRCARRLGAAAATALAVVGVTASSATAARNLTTGFADPRYQQYSGAQQDDLFNRTVSEQAGIVRFNVSWREVVAGSRPANPTDPGDPAYNFSALDSAVRQAASRGLQVLLTVYGAPTWAEGPNRPPVDDFHPAGSWKPDPNELASFATALATRYSGSYTPTSNGLPQIGATPLPRVDDYEAWNEENLWLYLDPQYDGKKQTSVELYRNLLNSFYDAVKAVNPNAQIVLGGNAPYGDDPGGRRTRPLIFLRDLFCLSGKLKPQSCPNPAKFDILGAHPINISGGPTLSAINPDDASSADLGNIAEVLRAAERHNTVATSGRHPIWVTEFWWRSFPDRGSPSIAGLAKHGRWIEQALYLYWRAGASVAINLQLIDDPRRGQGLSLQTGVFNSKGKPKPAATAFRFPFVLDRRSKHRLFAWGKAPAAGKLTIERKSGGGWRKEKVVNVKAGKVFTTGLKGRGGKYRARVGGQTSLVWSQH